MMKKYNLAMVSLLHAGEDFPPLYGFSSSIIRRNMINLNSVEYDIALCRGHPYKYVYITGTPGKNMEALPLMTARFFCSLTHHHCPGLQPCGITLWASIDECFDFAARSAWTGWKRRVQTPQLDNIAFRVHSTERQEQVDMLVCIAPQQRFGARESRWETRLMTWSRRLGNTCFVRVWFVSYIIACLRNGSRVFLLRWTEICALVKIVIRGTELKNAYTRNFIPGSKYSVADTENWVPIFRIFCLD